MSNSIKGVKGYVSIPIEERFNSKVDKSGGEDSCWLWTGSASPGSNNNGRGSYGSIWHNGKQRKATHVAIELATGIEFPKGMCACHTCDNPLCVNPKHLFIGTVRDNTIDCYQKGRGNKKKKSHCARGHELNDETTATRKNGDRYCKKCHALRKSINAKKRREALAAYEQVMGEK